MAASRRSLALTEAYRARTFAIRERLQAQAGRGWPSIEALDSTDWPDRMAATVAAGQVEALRATSGYLGAFLTSETRRRTRPLEIDPRAYSGQSRDGRELTDSLRSPLIGVLAALKDGSEPTEALRQGLIRAQRMVGVDFDHAHRTALLEAIERDGRFEGWERAVRGTCGACAGKATGPTGGLMFEVHPGCQCVSSPIVSGVANRFPVPTGAALFAAKTRDEQDAMLGSAAAEKVRAGASLTDLVAHSHLDSDQTDFLTQAPVGA